MTGKNPFDTFLSALSSCQTFNTLARVVYRDRHRYDVTFRSLLVFELLEPVSDAATWADISEIKNGKIRQLLVKIVEAPADRKRVVKLFDDAGLVLTKSKSGNGDVFFSWSEQTKEQDGRIRAIVLHVFFKSDAVLLPAPLFTITHVKSNQTKSSRKIAAEINHQVMQHALGLAENLVDEGMERLSAAEFSKEAANKAFEPPSPFHDK